MSRRSSNSLANRKVTFLFTIVGFIIQMAIYLFFTTELIVFELKGQLQRFDRLSLFDRFRHVENGFDVDFWKFVFVFLL